MIRPFARPSGAVLCRLIPSTAAFGARKLPGTGWHKSISARRLAAYATESFRKSLKDELKNKKRAVDSGAPLEPVDTPYGLDSKTIDEWELTVGIEIHAQLNTSRKLFSNARSATEETANSLAAVFDLSLPGSQPILQKSALLPALRAALALNCKVEGRSTFDRKHYFYQDQPAGYQITQYYSPLARSGQIELFDHDGIAPEDGQSLLVGIKQIQLEQDTAKSVQQPPDQVLLDFNRVGHPLIEIISLPHIHHPATAAAYVRKVSQLLLSVDAVTTGMELGGLRADVNVSVRRKDDAAGPHSYSGVSGLGQRTEIKNLSSFKAVEEAIIAERNRQIGILRRGGQIDGETRGWTLGSTETVRLRGKEGEVDYRYMPDPDIPPLFVSQDLLQHLGGSMPALPDEQLHDLTEKWGVSAKDSKTLIALEDGGRAQYFHDVLAELQGATQLEDDVAGRMAANWVLHELGGLFGVAEEEFDNTRVTAPQLAAILKALQQKSVSGKTAKQLLSMVFDGDGRHIEQIIDEDNLGLQRMTSGEYDAIARRLVDNNPQQAGKAQNGQRGKIQFFIGQMMRESQGTMDAEEAKRAVHRVLGVAP